MRNFRRISATILLLLTVAALAWASDVWKTKPYQQWNQKDVDKILNDSPWVKKTSVAANWKSGDVLTSPEIVTGSPSATNNPSAAMNGPGGLGMRPRERMVQFEARWVSAKTVREAMARLAVIEKKLMPATAKSKLATRPNDYMIAITGKDMTPFSKLEGADLAKTSYLKMSKSKEKLAPSSVSIDRSPGSSKVVDVIFHFAKTVNGQPTIAANEKGIEFVCKVAKSTLRFRFDPRKMTGKTGREL